MIRRALNRATLARQFLLERTRSTVLETIEHLVGLQAQTPHTWYVGLWTRVEELDPKEVGALLEQRALVRLPVMRSTIHLLTSDDALAMRPLAQQPIVRSTLGQFGRHLKGIEPDELSGAAREIVEESPRLASELGRMLAERFPGHDPNALAQAARAWLPMVQIPPRGVWGRSGRALQAPLESWLGRPQLALPVEQLVARYLAAFGPATVRDVQTWSGLTKLGEVVERMRLPVLVGEDGAELFDLPDAPRPDPNTPAPVRFLYDYDNLLLSHADRRRVLGDPGDTDYAGHGYSIDSNMQPASVLVDGMVAATWTVARKRGAATLTVRAFRNLTAAERAEIETEGAELLLLLHPGDTHDVTIR